MANTISWSRVLLLSLFWLQLLCANGYFLDESCKRIEHKIKVSMHKVKESAEGALAELNKKEEDQNAHVTELRKLFFRDQDMARVKSTYHFIPYLTEINKPHTPQVQQPTIYCNLNRFEEKHGPLYDEPEVDYLIDHKEGIIQKRLEGYDKCKDGRSMAFTSIVNKPGRRYLSIQLCPWYLNQVLGTKFTNAEGTLPDAHGAKNYDPKRQSSKDDPDADVFSSRLDFTFLHELAHALPGGYDLEDDPAYGWHKCMALPTAEGWKNPESYAFFALGVRRIQDNHFTFNEDGMAVSIKDKAKRFEQAVMRLWNA